MPQDETPSTTRSGDPNFSIHDMRLSFGAPASTAPSVVKNEASDSNWTWAQLKTAQTKEITNGANSPTYAEGDTVRTWRQRVLPPEPTLPRGRDNDDIKATSALHNVTGSVLIPNSVIQPTALERIQSAITNCDGPSL